MGIISGNFRKIGSKTLLFYKKIENAVYNSFCNDDAFKRLFSPKKLGNSLLGKMLGFSRFDVNKRLGPSWQLR